jgi:hypothetical protein
MKVVRPKVTTKGNGATLQQHVDARGKSNGTEHPAVSPTGAALASKDGYPIPEHDRKILRYIFGPLNQAAGRFEQAKEELQVHQKSLKDQIEKLCIERGLKPEDFQLTPDGSALIPKPKEGGKGEGGAPAGDLAAKVAENLARRKQNKTAPSVN